MRALVIPVEGPIIEITLDGGSGDLAKLQEAVGGWIEAVPLPEFITGSEHATAYVNEEGQIHRLPANMRATDFMVPGVGLMWNDYIAGPLVLAGFNPETGENADLPDGVIARARLIEEEAGSPVSSPVPRAGQVFAPDELFEMQRAASEIGEAAASSFGGEA